MAAAGPSLHNALLVGPLFACLAGRLHHFCLLGRSFGGKLAADETFSWASPLPVDVGRDWQAGGAPKR